MNFKLSEYFFKLRVHILLFVEELVVGNEIFKLGFDHLLIIWRSNVQTPLFEPDSLP